MINYDYADGPAPGSSTSVSPDPTHEGFWGRMKSFNFKNDTTYKNSYTYDGTGRLDQIMADHSISTVFDYTYHANANVVDYLQHGSYSQDVVYRSDSYLQDKLIHKWGSDLTKDQEARYTYDTLGRRSYEKTSGLVVEDLRPAKDRWGAKTSYNDRNELTEYRLYEMTTSWSVSSTTAIAGTRQSYTLDHMGNRTGGYQNDVSGTYTSSNPHDGLNQYSTARNLTVDYDNAGNMTDYGTKDYVYDAEDRLVKVTVGTTHYKYKYDYLGRRIGKYTGSTLNKKFVYQGWNLIAELSSTGSVQRTFTWGLDVSTTLHGAGGVGGLLLIDDESTSKRYYPIYDGSRNIVGLYDQTGALVASYEYDAFGRMILQSSGDYSDDNPFRFSTKYTDDETGLVWYGHRYYEPELGRFINRDPIEEDGGLNLYGFVGNDPVNFYDYLGMILWIPRSYNPEDQPTHKNEEPDPDILDDELRDEAEGRARAIAMERAGGLLSWIVQGAPVTYLDRLEGLYEAAFDRVENELDRYYDEIEREVVATTEVALLSQIGDLDSYDAFNVPNSVKKDLAKRWTLSKVYGTLSQLGESGRVASMLLKTVDISSFSKVKVKKWDKTTGKLLGSSWNNNMLGFEINGKIYINEKLPLERAIETLIHEYSHTLGLNEMQARVYATGMMVQLGLSPIRANWVDSNGNINPVIIKRQIPSSYNYRLTLDAMKGETLLQTGAPFK